MVNELVEWYKGKHKNLLFLKIDFEKAYNFVSLDFLDRMMEFMNFGSKGRCWIQFCLESARSFVLVNGSPTLEFQLQRGLRIACV